MYEVVLDTDILRQDPQRRSAAWRRLQHLLNEGHVRSHIPDVVRREFLTSVTTEYRSHLKNAENALRQIRADFIEGHTPDLITALGDLRTVIDDKWHQDFDGWCKRQNVTIHPTPPDGMARVIDAYFEGGAPFKKPKNREDFPDALIYVTVESIRREFRDLYFITRDERLSEAVARSKVRCFPSLDAFLTSTYQELVERNDERIFDLLFANVSLLEGEAGRHLRHHFEGTPFESPKLPFDEGQISEVDAVDVFIRLPAADKLGGGYFRFPFEATAIVTVEDEAGSWTMYGYDDEDDGEEDDLEPDTAEGRIEVEGILEVHVPFLGSPDRYAENELLRRAMYLAEHEIIDVAIHKTTVK